MTDAATIDSSAARKAMIDSQLRVSGITDPAVLAAMAAVPREDHVPAAARGHAYIDRAIPLDATHALPSPLAQAMLLSEAAPTAADKILVVHGGSTYLAALVEAMGLSVDVASAADAAAGKAVGGGYSLILIDGAVEHVPAATSALLANGGRVVAGLVRRGVTSLAVGQKSGADVALKAQAEIGMPVLSEFAQPKSWSF
jgi:protein-L-isoaspartate(D-aspartate) O-methyltransferase